MQQSRWRVWRYVAVLAAGVGGVTSRAQSPADRWWTGYGNGPDNSRYFASRRSTSPTSDSSRSPGPIRTATPAAVRSSSAASIYGRGRNGSLVALDAKTGKELWVREGMNGMTSRGMNYWESAGRHATGG